MLVSSTQAESGRQPIERHGATPRPNAPPPLDHTPWRNAAPRKAGLSRRPPASSPSSPGRSSSASDHRVSRLSAALSRAGSVACYAAGFLVAVAALLALPLQAQAQTTDATLTGLALWDVNFDPVPLNETFASTLLTYTASVANIDDEITVTPTRSDANATIEYLDGDGVELTDADPDTNGIQVDLDTGENVIQVKVTAEDTTTTKTYRVTVTRAGPTTSDDATLSALALSGVTLAPTFVSSTETYTATVGNSVTETTVTATPTHSGATVAFKDGDDNALTNPVTLAVGANVIKAEVTAEDTTTTKTYRVTVTREAAAGTCLAPTFTGRAEVWRGTITVGNDAFSRGYEDNRFGDLSDPDNFDYGGTNYTIAGIRESFDTGSVNRLELDLDAFLPDSDQDKLRLHLCGDTFDLTTATQAGTSTYRWTDAVLDWSGATTIEAALSGTLSTDATLSALALSGVTLDPTFVSSTETYTATVGNSVTETTVTATPTHSGATVAFKYGDDTALTNPVTLAEGANVIKAVVTAEDTTTMKTYMVTVTREATTTTAPAIVTGGVQVTSTSMTGDTYGFGETIEITVTFDKAVTVDTSGGTPRIQFRLDGNKNRWAQYSRGSATTALVFTYTVLAGDMDTDGIWLAANLLQLRSGTIRDATDNTVAATLTYDEPGLQTEHKVDGSRTTTVDATLRILRLSGVTLDPTFVSTTETYTATVVNSVTETTVTATPTHSGATVAFKDGADIALTNPVTLAEGANVIKAVVTSEDTTTMKTYMVTVTRGTTTAPEIVADGVQVTSTPMATGGHLRAGRDHRNHGHLRQRGHGGHVRRHAPDRVPPRRGSEPEQVGRVQQRFGGHGPDVHLYGAGRRHGCQRHLACGEHNPAL